MSTMHLGIFGAGLSGKHISRFFHARHIDVWGTTRSKDNFDTLRASGMEPFVFDGEFVSESLLILFSTLTHLVVSIAPTSDGDPTLNAFSRIDHLSDYFPSLRWVVYLSTVGVYGNHDGLWVDEETPLSPISERSKQRVLAESQWQEWADSMDVPLAIFRLSGIYGEGRNALHNAKLGKARRLIKEGQVFNRIHASDIAQAVFLASQNNVSGIFNITDNEPCPPQDVVVFAHELLGLEPPPPQDFETAKISDMARSFYGENKRVSNDKSKSILGMRYNYPDYRTSLRHMFERDRW